MMNTAVKLMDSYGNKANKQGGSTVFVAQILGETEGMIDVFAQSCYTKGAVQGEAGRETMLQNAFDTVYTKFKLHDYKEIFDRFQKQEISLTTVEVFCMETIKALGRPTVNEFATFMNISSPNAAYKVNCLSRKGYIRKVQSQTDRREYHLEVTQKYMDAYDLSDRYTGLVMGRIVERFTPEEWRKLTEMLEIVSHELMPEVDIPDQL